jgi:hypothetical protein
MILSRFGIIFLHLHKTGGNSVQSALLPLSDDRRVRGMLQDGVNRFGIVGPVTPHKHATLADYAARLGPDLPGFRVAMTCREPFDRAVALYFLPHRWVRPSPDGTARVVPPRWDRDDFLAFVSQLKTAAHFLTVEGQVRRPDWLLRFERLAEDFGGFVRSAGLPLDPTQLPHVNRGIVAETQRALALGDTVANDAVRAKFQVDYELFGYPR